jgi:hypothetical protein
MIISTVTQTQQSFKCHIICDKILYEAVAIEERERERERESSITAGSEQVQVML